MNFLKIGYTYVNTEKVTHFVIEDNEVTIYLDSGKIEFAGRQAVEAAIQLVQMHLNQPAPADGGKEE